MTELVRKWGPILKKVEEVRKDLIPFKLEDLVRDLTQEECERIRQEFLRDLPEGSQVSIDPIGVAHIQLPLYVSRSRGGRGEPTEDDLT